MMDTIELLEAIGSDAALRYASAGDLAGILGEARASAMLISAVTAGDGSMLAGEFGSTVYYTTESTQAPGHEEEEEDEEPAPEGDRSPSLR